MPNHAHIVFKHLSEQIKQEDNDYPITDIMASFKKFTARLCNKNLGRTGSPFWQGESFDHVVRDSDELQRVIYYTLQNPVKAGLANEWRDWPHSYCREEISSRF
ncbi:MAG: hypothetical protein WEA79_00730 [Balneolaceae bacterium]